VTVFENGRTFNLASFESPLYSTFLDFVAAMAPPVLAATSAIIATIIAGDGRLEKYLRIYVTPSQNCGCECPFT